MENEKNCLERNVSRLVKLAADPATPGRGFTDSLVNSALDELSVEAAAPVKTAFLRGRIDRAMGAAAMAAIACGAAVHILLSAMAWANPVLAGTLFITMCTNWLSYVGRLII